MDSMQTTETFQVLKMGADAYIKRRNQRLLSNHRKELRKFTRAEAFTYLDIDAKTLDKYVSTADFDPRRHEDSQWLINIEEMYQLRDLLPENLRKASKFKRSDNQKCRLLLYKIKRWCW